MVSYAFEKSINIPQVYILLSLSFLRLSAISQTACAVERPFLKPNWNWKSIWFFFDVINKLLID